MKDKTKLDVIVYDKTKKKLKELASSYSQPISKVVEQAIINYLMSKPKKVETNKSRMCLTISTPIVEQFKEVLGTSSNRDMIQILDKILTDFFKSKNKGLVNKNQLSLYDTDKKK